jgi:hypothetical protein
MMHPVNTDKRKWLIFRCRLLHQLANRPQSKENYYEKLRGLSYNGKKVRPPRRHCNSQHTRTKRLSPKIHKAKWTDPQL